MFGLIDQAIRQFYDQWSFGFQPSVMIETKPNGIINVTSRVACHLPSSPTKQHQPQPKRRRSGRASRLRRRESRECSQSIKTVDQSAAEPRPQKKMNLDKLIDGKQTEAIEMMKSMEKDICQTDIRNCIDLLDEEIRKKDDQIFKLQLNVADLKVKSHSVTPPMSLTMHQISSIDIPPSPSRPEMNQALPSKDTGFNGLSYLPRYGGASV